MGELLSRAIFANLVLIYFAVHIIKGYFIKGVILRPVFEKFRASEEIFYEQHKKYLDVGALCIIVLSMVFLITVRTIPLIQDYSLMRNGQCCEIEGRIISISNRGSESESLRTIIMEDLTARQKVRVRLNSPLFEENEIICVRYGPNTHIGEVIEDMN